MKGKDYEGVVVPDSMDASFQIGDKPRWSPDDSHIVRAEAALRPALAADSQARNISPKLGRYQRQYIGFLEGTKRRLYINAFCEHGQDMRQQIIDVSDGGDCFFQATYDVETDAILEVSVNGEA